MNESTEKQEQHHCICEDIAELMRKLGPSDSVVEHFRNARIEVLKGIRQMIDERTEGH
jgi:hypothetical protein